MWQMWKSSESLLWFWPLLIPWKLDHVSSDFSSVDLLSLGAEPFLPVVARDLFAKWAENPKNVTIFVTPGPPNSFARELQRFANVDLSAGQARFKMELRRRIPLEGSELLEYQKQQNAKKVREQLALRQSSMVEVDTESDEDDDDKDVQMDDSAPPVFHPLSFLFYFRIVTPLFLSQRDTAMIFCSRTRSISVASTSMLSTTCTALPSPRSRPMTTAR